MQHGQLLVDDRATYDAALAAARRAAYPPGELVGQESFVLASEILALAHRAGVGPTVRLLDVCCGAGGPGRLIRRELRCAYVGVDVDETAVRLARRRASDGAELRFEVGRVPPLPDGEFDVVLLLETLLAFADKRPLLQAVGESLVPGGRFALTVEEGPPLTSTERRLMPASDTVWPVSLATLLKELRCAGLEVRWLRDSSRSHQRIAQALAESFTQHRAAIAAALGDDLVDHLITSHRLWASWLATGRVRKLALVATTSPAPTVRPAAAIASERSSSW